MAVWEKGLDGVMRAAGSAPMDQIVIMQHRIQRAQHTVAVNRPLLSETLELCCEVCLLCVSHPDEPCCLELVVAEGTNRATGASGVSSKTDTVSRVSSDSNQTT